VSRHKKLPQNLYSYNGRYPRQLDAASVSFWHSLQSKPDEKVKNLTFRFDKKDYHIEVPYNYNTVRFLKEYPQMDLVQYFEASVESDTANALLKPLAQIIDGMTQTEAVNLLLRFVPTSFRYQTDQNQFGAENYMFVEETIIYPASDCEDRAILFAWLVRELLGLKVVALDFPGHVATAGRLICNIQEHPDSGIYQRRKTMKKIKLLSAALCASTLMLAGCTPQIKSVHEDLNVNVNAVESSKMEYKGPKLRIGVVNFQNNAPRKVRGIEMAATNILTTMLQETGNFIVISQQHMESILQQQKMAASGAINAATAAQMGKVLGLNAILTGSITSYAELVEGFNTFLKQSKTQVAKVGVDYRIVDTTTGVQLFASHGNGEFRKKTGGLLGFGSKSSRDTSLKDGALRDALGKAMNKIMSQLSSDLWTGRIALVKGSTVYINAGKLTGLNIGDVLEVQELGDEIIDPQTGVSLGRAPGVSRGELKISGFFGKDGSVATIISGSGFNIGDLVKLKGR